MKNDKKQNQIEKEIKYLKNKSKKNQKKDFELGYMEWLDYKDKDKSKK